MDTTDYAFRAFVYVLPTALIVFLCLLYASGLKRAIILGTLFYTVRYVIELYTSSEAMAIFGDKFSAVTIIGLVVYIIVCKKEKPPKHSQINCGSYANKK